MAEGLSLPVHDQLCDWLFPLLVSLVWLVIVGQAFDDIRGHWLSAFFRESFRLYRYGSEQCGLVCYLKINALEITQDISELRGNLHRPL